MHKPITVDDVKAMTHSERMRALGVTVLIRTKAQVELAEAMRKGNLGRIAKATAANTAAMRDAALLRYR